MATITEMLKQPPAPVVATTENAPPLQAPAPSADPYAEFSTPATKDPYAEFSEPANDPYAEVSRPADDLDVRSVEELDADRDTFNPKEYYAANPDVASDPAKLQKLLEVYRRRDKEGLKAGQVFKEATKEAIPTVGKIFGGARDLLAGAINVGIQPAVNLAGSVVTGDIFNPQMREELAKETKRVQKKGIAEIFAGSETSATGISDLARTGLRKLDTAAGQAAVSELGEPPVEKSDQQLLQQLNEDVAFSKQMQEVASGRGETAKKLGLDADTLAKEGVTVDPAVIERLSLVDPLTIVAGGGVFKAINSAGQVVLSAATRAAAENAVGKLLAGAAAAPIKAAGAVTRAAGTVARAAAPYVPTLSRRSIVGLAGRGAQLAGQGLSRVGEAVADSATFQKALTGAVEGAAAAAPLAAASDEDKTAGAIFGAGALLGGGVRGLVEAANVPARVVAGRKLAARPIEYAPTESRPYGISDALDQAHEQGMQALPEAQRNQVNSFREATRNLGGEVYVLSPEVFEQSLLENAERAKGAPLTGEDLTRLRDLTSAQGYFDTTLTAPDGSTRRAVFLNSSAGELPHEAGHLFHALLSPERQAELLNTAREVYTPEQIDSYQTFYEQQLGRPVSRDYVLHELIAENFSQLFNHTPLAELSAPPTLAQRIGRTITDFAEQAGLDLTAGQRTPFGAPSSLRFNDVVRDAAREVLQPRPPKPIVQPRQVSLGEAAREIGPVEPAEIVSPRTETQPRAELPVQKAPDAAQEARTIASEAPDTPIAGGTRSPRELLGQIAESIAKNEGVKLNYLSAPDEPAAATTSNRTVRREIIEAFRTMPPEARALWEKTFFPEKVTRTAGGKYQIQGWAPEVFASNAHKLARFLADTPEAQRLSPYEIDPQTKSFTPEAWQELYQDTQRFVQNQIRGATGAGEPLVVPRSVTEAGGFAPPTRPGAKALDQGRADFINLLFNFKLPETPRIQTGRRPLNVMGQEVSRATKPGRVEEPVRPRGEYAGEEAQRQGIEGVSIAEVNPLRNQLEAAALAAKKPMPSFIEAVQKLNLENIKEVQGAPEQPQFRGNTLTLSAGFQPRDWRVSGQKGGLKDEVTVKAEDPAEARRLAENQGFRVTKVEASDKVENAFFQPKSVIELADQVEKFSPQEFRDWAASVGSRGFTAEAWDVGRASPDQAFTDSLKTTYDQLSANIRPSIAEAIRTGKFDDVSALASQVQFFKEAYEAATGTGSAGEALRRIDPNYEPPFPGESAQFQPKKIEKALDDILTAHRANGGSTYNPTSGEVLRPGEPAYIVSTFPERTKLVKGNDLSKKAIRDYAKANADLLAEPEHSIGTWYDPASDQIYIDVVTQLQDREAAVQLGREANQKAIWDNKAGQTIDTGGTGEEVIKPVKSPRIKNKDFKLLPPKAGFSKAWILPNGEPVQLGGKWHHQWLSENPDVAEKYGLDVPAFEGGDAEGVREGALRKGFSRVNYSQNSGMLTVEARAKDWRRLKGSVERLVESNLDNIDRMEVHLLNDTADKIVDSQEAKLFNYDDAEKLQHLPFITEGEVRGQFQPKKQEGELPFDARETARRTAEQEIVDVAAKYPEALPLQYKTDKEGNMRFDKKGKPEPKEIPYKLSETPLAEKAGAGKKKEAKESAIVDAYVKKLKSSYAQAAKNPEIAAGANWYSLAREKLSKAFGPDTKFFTELLGATSAQTDVATNFRNAIDAYNNFKEGKYNDQIAKYREGKEIWESGKLPAEADLGENPTRAAFMEWWIDTHNLKPTKTNGKLFGANSNAVLKVLDGSWREEVQGPKTPNFAGNLSGDTFEATIDIWAARLLRRLGNSDNKGQWRILPKNETGVRDPDFFLGQKIFRKAGDELGISPDSLQAIMWFAEKDYWDKQGWTKSAGAAKSDFNTFLDITERAPTGQMKIREEDLAKPKKESKKQIELEL